MTSQGDFISGCDQWLASEGPMHHSVVSSRARYARNLKGVAFAPRASREQLREGDEARGARRSGVRFRCPRRLHVGELRREARQVVLDVDRDLLVLE